MNAADNICVNCLRLPALVSTESLAAKFLRSFPLELPAPFASSHQGEIDSLRREQKGSHAWFEPLLTNCRAATSLRLGWLNVICQRNLSSIESFLEATTQFKRRSTNRMLPERCRR